jgi:hypothetical protein
MPSERHLIIESPEMHNSPDMQSYISQEVARPCKQWIHEVLCAQREAERVKLRTTHFVLLPDVDTTPNQMFSRLLLDRPSERWQSVTRNYHHQHCTMVPNTCAPKKHAKDGTPQQHPMPCPVWMQSIERRWRSRKQTNSIHWLAVATDTSLRTMRDLRGHHIPMLIALYTQACQKIHEEMGIPLDQIMAYVHYPPSVYQLHVHFKHPIGPHISQDSFRIHSLASIINNLNIDSDYYAKSVLQLPVYSHTELYTALGLPNHKQDQIQTQLYVTNAEEKAETIPVADPQDTVPVEKNHIEATEWIPTPRCPE